MGLVRMVFVILSAFAVAIGVALWAVGVWVTSDVTTQVAGIIIAGTGALFGIMTTATLTGPWGRIHV